MSQLRYKLSIENDGTIEETSADTSGEVQTVAGAERLVRDNIVMKDQVTGALKKLVVRSGTLLVEDIE